LVRNHCETISINFREDVVSTYWASTSFPELYVPYAGPCVALETDARARKRRIAVFIVKERRVSE
jgi:hypothetical protein